jgi:hypothetical protein
VDFLQPLSARALYDILAQLTPSRSAVLPGRGSAPRSLSALPAVITLLSRHFQGCPYPRSVIKLEARRALNIEVPAGAQRAVCADNHLLAAAGKLDRGELLLVVLLKRGTQLLDQARLMEGKSFDIYGGRKRRSELELLRQTGTVGAGVTHACNYIGELGESQVSKRHAMRRLVARFRGGRCSPHPEGHLQRRRRRSPWGMPWLAGEGMGARRLQNTRQPAFLAVVVGAWW